MFLETNGVVDMYILKTLCVGASTKKILVLQATHTQNKLRKTHSMKSCYCDLL